MAGGEDVATLNANNAESLIRAAEREQDATARRQEALDEHRLLNSSQTCRLLGISPRTLWGWQQRGLVPYFKIGGSIRFKLADINLSLERFRVGGIAAHARMRQKHRSRGRSDQQ